MVKKAIFGGTFDPIHNGHLQIAYEALYYLNLDKVVFMPSGNPPHKRNIKITDSSIRCQLVEKAISNEKKFEIDYYEVNRKELSYTYQTLKHYNQLEPNTEWYFLTGADCLIDIDEWSNVDKILDNCIFTVFSRNQYAIEQVMKQKKRVEQKYNKEIIFMDVPILPIASTSIRNRIKSNKNASYLVPSGVYELIEDMKLYK